MLMRGRISQAALFAALVILAVGLFHRPLYFVLGRAVLVDQYAPALIAPPLSALMFFTRRRQIFSSTAFSPLWLMVYGLGGAGFVLWSRSYALAPADRILSLAGLLFVTCLLSAFLASFGTKSFVRAGFPLLFLLLTIPLPDSWVNRSMSFLQYASADAVALLFSAVGVPVEREGVIFHLSTLSIEVARECSGIRSTLILMMIALVLGHLFLKSWWAQMALAASFVVISIAKNGLRIFVLTMLGTHVNVSFLTGRLHRNGGVIFFLVGVLCLWGVMLLLERVERHRAVPNGPIPTDSGVV